MSEPVPDLDDLSTLIAIRRDIHAHPELGFEEVRTAAIVGDFLAECGLEVHRGLGKTGVVATLRGSAGGPAIALRADMDALAMPETADRPHRSTVAGRMHACGHDGHTAMLLGAARALSRRKDLAGTVHFVFQPAEEGRGGAAAMVEDGLFERFRIERFYAMHNMPGIAVGHVAAVRGAQLASSDRWNATFRGLGTHGGKPHLGRDPIVAAGQFLSSVQAVVSRGTDPVDTAVVSACAIAAGDFEALNVIPDEVHVGGTARAYSHAVRERLAHEIGRAAQGIAQANGIEVDYAFHRLMPPVVNDDDAIRRATEAATEALGAQNVLTEFPPSTAGDDFAVFSSRVPSAYVWLGNGPAEDGALHHNTRYDFNDGAIGPGVRFWTTLVERELRAV